MSSTIAISVGGDNVTNNVLYQGASFELSQTNVPGTFEITIKDPERTLGPYVTGDEISVDVDSIRLFGGYVTQVSRRFALPADLLPTDTRLWVLRGVDYNILFDKRVIRRPANYLRRLPNFHGDDQDGDLVKQLIDDYIDLPAGFDGVTEIDNIGTIPEGDGDPDYVGGWKQQGTTWREQMEMFAEWTGAVWYISPDKKVHWHSLETTMAPFGFSDDPDGTTTIGMRDVTATEDASDIVNDAFVWGGSEWTEGVVFARAERSTSITNHGRWQTAEHHFGEAGYKLDTQWRADLIVDGHSSKVGYNPGKRFPQWQVNLSWYAENVPGSDHIRAGQLVSIDLTTFGGALSPIILPVRQVGMTFEGVSEEGGGHVKFTGQFGLSLDDSRSLWAFVRKLRRQRNTAVAAATNAITESTYGSFGQFEPVSISSTVYDLPNDIGYIGGTTTVYVDGVLQLRGTQYTESDPVAGEITFASAPSGVLWVVCRTT